MAKATDAVPAICISLEHDRVFGVGGGLAVLAQKQVRQFIALIDADVDLDAHRFRIEVMKSENGIPAPVVAHRKDAFIPCADNFESSPAEFGTLLSQSDHSLGPVQKRIGIS